VARAPPPRKPRAKDEAAAIAKPRPQVCRVESPDWVSVRQNLRNRECGALWLLL